MRKNPITIISLSAFILITAGCTKMYIDASAVPEGVYLSGAKSLPGMASKGSFEVTLQATWTLFGLTPLKEPDLSSVLQKEIRALGGNAVMGLTIVTHQTFLDGLLGVVTIGLYIPRTITLKGQVVEVPQTMWGPDTLQESVAEKLIREGVVVYSFPGFISPETSLVFN